MDDRRQWVAHAAADFGVDLRTVEVPDDLCAKGLEAQQRQVMVNLTVDEALAVERSKPRAGLVVELARELHSAGIRQRARP